MTKIDRGVRYPVSFRLNGELVHGYAENRLLLSDFLRHEVGATGTHVGCEHGICGACTVLVNGLPVRSCLMLAVQVEDCDVQTIEGLALAMGLSMYFGQLSTSDLLPSAATVYPGILMTLQHLKSQNRDFSEEEIRDALGGHICRCTGYREIIDAAMDVMGADSRQTDD